MLALESGTCLKKWKGRLPVALLYPNTYSIGVSSLGFQLVYSLLNAFDDLVCERFFLPEAGESLRSFESQRPLSDFPLIFYSISFEHDYLNLARLLLAADIPLFGADRADEIITPENPLIIGGGVATFMNPEPLAPFTDLFLLGEAEGMLGPLFSSLERYLATSSRSLLLSHLQQAVPGAYVPALYTPLYDQKSGQQYGVTHSSDIPKRISKGIVSTAEKASHSQLLSPEAEFSDLYV
ncbi:MAG: radical SAM protein, partial [Desulfocapsa sp.]